MWQKKCDLEELSQKSSLKREPHAAVFHHKAWNTYRATTPYGIESSVSIAQQQKLFQVAHVFSYIHKLVIAIARKLLNHRAAIRACSHNIHFNHNRI